MLQCNSVGLKLAKPLVIYNSFYLGSWNIVWKCGCNKNITDDKIICLNINNLHQEEKKKEERIWKTLFWYRYENIHNTFIQKLKL